jgi:DNA-binding LytR/AlgR family response regulator
MRYVNGHGRPSKESMDAKALRPRTARYFFTICSITDSAFNGGGGLRLIEKSLLDNRPYSVAFVDVRLGSGWDGVQTTCKIWQQYPDLQVVLCTGYSDRPWEELVKSLGFLDRMIVLVKPFDVTEVKQLAVGFSEKWRLTNR